MGSQAPCSLEQYERDARRKEELRKHWRVVCKAFKEKPLLAIVASLVVIGRRIAIPLALLLAGYCFGRFAR